MPATLKVTEVKNTVIVQSSDTNLTVGDGDTDTIVVPVVETTVLSVPSNKLVVENIEPGFVKLSAGQPTKIVISNEFPKLVKEEVSSTKLAVNKINSRVTPVTEVVSIISVAEQGPPGTDYGVFVNGEIPTGVVDGVNDLFTINAVPISGSVKVFLNGLRLVNLDYSLLNATITMVEPPFLGDIIEVDYRY